MDPKTRRILKVETDRTVRCQNCGETYESANGETVAELRDAIRSGDFDQHPCVRGFVREAQR